MRQLFSPCSTLMTRANRSAVFPPVHQRMTRMRLFPRAGKNMDIAAGIRKHSRFEKENSKKTHKCIDFSIQKSFEPDKSLPTGWMNSILYRSKIFPIKVILNFEFF